MRKQTEELAKARDDITPVTMLTVSYGNFLSGDPDRALASLALQSPIAQEIRMLREFPSQVL